MSCAYATQCLIHGAQQPCRLDGCVFRLPWVSGARIGSHWRGWVFYEELVPYPSRKRDRGRSWSRALERVLRRTLAEARLRHGANCLTDFDVDAELKPEGLFLKAKATAAKMEPVQSCPVIA